MSTLRKNILVDFHKGYQLSLENALNHIDSAIACESISFGIANSHLILASEEAIKAAQLFTLYFDKDYQNEIKDFDEYFSNHKYKHKAIRSIEFVGLAIEKTIEIQTEPFLDVKEGSLSKEEFIQKRDEGIKNTVKWIDGLRDGKESFDTNEEWWNQADGSKKVGFYVNLLKKKGEWEGPLSIKKSQYTKSKKTVTKFVSRIKVMEDMIQKPEIYELYFKYNKRS